MSRKSFHPSPEVDERTRELLRASFPDIFTVTTSEELFSLPNDQPFGEVGVDIFFSAGGDPIE